MVNEGKGTQPAIRKAKLHEPVEVLIYLDTFRRVGRLHPSMSKEKEALERLRKTMFRSLTDSIDETMRRHFPDGSEDIVIGTMTIEERKITREEHMLDGSPFPPWLEEKQIEASIRVYRKKRLTEVYIDNITGGGDGMRIDNAVSVLRTELEREVFHHPEPEKIKEIRISRRLELYMSERAGHFRSSGYPAYKSKLVWAMDTFDIPITVPEGWAGYTYEIVMKAEEPEPKSEANTMPSLNIIRPMIWEKQDALHAKTGRMPKVLILSEYAYMVLCMEIKLATTHVQKDTAWTYDIKEFEGMRIVRIEDHPTADYYVSIQFGRE